MIRSNGFTHVLCRLWLIGLTANYLGVITKRGKTRMIWLWLGDTE